MRVLVVTSMYPPHHLGGYELLCRDTLQRWVSAGHQVLVLTTDYQRPGTVDPDPVPGIEVRRELEWYWDGEFRHPSPRERFGVERRNQRRLRRAVHDHRPEVVSMWQLGGMSLGLIAGARRQGLPIVYVVGDGWLGYGPQVDPWTSGWRRHPRFAAVAARATGVPTGPPRLVDSGRFCFISSWLEQRSAAVLDGEFTDAVVVAPGIDQDLFAPADPSLPRPWRHRLLCVGRVEPRKGFRTAVAALPELPEAVLHVDGPDEGGHVEQLAALGHDLGVSERLTFGATRRAELPGRYADADALLFTSVWDEPFGLVPLEAMACATPVVATGTGGSAEYLRHENNCLLVPPDDPAALVLAVRRLAADPELRGRLRRGGVETAAAYSVADYAERLAAEHAAVA